jgi:hypothetical protein
LVGRRKHWQIEVEQVKRMQSWIYEAEENLSGHYFEKTYQGEVDQDKAKLSDEKVGRVFDEWCEGLQKLQNSGSLGELEKKSLTHFLAITAN